MLRTLEQIINGKYEYETKKPILSIEKVEDVTAQGADFRGSITIKSPDRQRLRVIATVTNARIALEKERYSGTEIIINFGIDVCGLRPGDSVTGDMIFSTNCGECIIPVRLTIEKETNRSSIGDITSLDDLTALAKHDFNEAYHFFTSPAMRELIAKEDSSLKTVFDALSVNPVTFQRLEEFLVYTGRKEALRYISSAKESTHLMLEDSVQGVLSVQKNTWGNVNLNVSVTGGFIEVPQKHFIAEDFVGNVLDIRYVIRYDRLGDAVNKGKITVNSDTDSFELHITASKADNPFSRRRLKYKKNIFALERAFVDYFTGNADKHELLSRGFEACEMLNTVEPTVRLTLMETYLHFLSGDNSFAEQNLRELDDYDFARESALCEAAYIYISYKTGHAEYGREELADELSALFEEDPGNVIILHMILDVDEEMKKRPQRVLSILNGMYAGGSRSPFIYLEASFIFREHPELLESMGSFVRFVLQNMARYGLLTDELALKAAVLSGNEKTFSYQVYDILTRAYDAFGTDELLEAVCRLIIKGNPRKREYHKWFELAVAGDIRITRLYEYYMETLPEGYKEILPFKIRRYFTLNNTLGTTDKAALYANIISNRSLDEDTYEDYRDRITNFAFESLQRGYISEDFAAIYREYITQLPTRKTADAMTAVMFTHLVICDDPRVREVVVRHPALAAEKIYPVRRGRAYVDKYSEDAVILFRDERGRRFINGIHYSISSIIEYRDYLTQCVKQKVADTGLFISLNTDREGKAVPVSSDNADMMLYLSASDDVCEEYRRMTGIRLLEYFANHAGDERGERFIMSGSAERTAEGNPVLYGEMLIMYGRFEEAFKVLCRYGYERLDTEKLLQLAGRLIEEREYQYDEELLLMSLYVYNMDRYDERVLTYLIKYFKGLVSVMGEIRRKAADFLMDTFVLDERILKTAMFVKVHPKDGAEIYETYCREGGKPIVKDAYLLFEAMYCFMNDRTLEPFIENCIKEKLSGKDTDLILKLAYLRSYAGRRELKEPELSQVRSILDECVKKNIIFSFYKKFPTELLGKYELDDKLIIECKALPGDKVMIHYNYPFMKVNEFITVPMKMVWAGIFSRSFVMFEGEKLKYYFTVNRGSDTLSTDMMAKVMKVDDPKGRSAYSRINQMIIADKNDDQQEFEKLYRKYRLAKHVTDDLFEIKTQDQ